MKTIVKQSTVKQAKHIAAINDIIKEAVIVADSEHPKSDVNAYRTSAWDRAFHRAMNRMTIAAGLRCA